MVRLQIAPGVTHWRERLDRAAQSALLNDVLARVELAPFYRPVMPKTAAPFSVLETNFGTLGWISDRSGYRYAKTHPATGQAWPDIPHALLALWNEMAQYEAPPQCCLVDLYLGNAKMGLHQDRDEEARDAPVLSVSLGEAALFRIGGDRDKRKTASVKLLLRRCGDVRRPGETCLSRHRPGDRRKLDAGARWRAHQLDPAPCHISEQKNARPGGLTGRYAPLRAGYREGMTGIR